MKDGFAATAHGRIHYLEAGAGDPVILIHSNGCSAHEYAPAMERMAARVRVIAMDLPGHGDSDPIARHYAIDDYADALVALMDALGLATASAGGSSVGGTISVALGSRHGARIPHLFVIEAPTRSYAEWAAAWPEVEGNFGLPTQTRAQLEPRLTCEVTDELLARWNIDRNKTGAHTLMDAMWAIREYDVLAHVPRITSRTLLVYGDKSPTMSGVPKIRNLLPSAKLATIANAGHFPMLDQPEEFADAITGFMAGSPARQGVVA